MDDKTVRMKDTPNQTKRVPAPGSAEPNKAQPGSGNAVRPGQVMPLGFLPAGYRLPDGFIVKETLAPHESQRPGLYLCSRNQYEVMVKIAPTDYMPRPDVWGRLADLKHPNIVRTFGTMVYAGLYIEVQEYCSGGTLADRITKNGQKLTTAAAEWIANSVIPQVNAGLTYLHDKDIVHRDIKPSNIYFRKDAAGKETLVLGDFDVSSVLERAHTSRDTQRLGGTWHYTAPEAFPRFVDENATAQRGRVTRSADYYSLGVTLVELIQGTTSLHMCELPDLFDFYLQGNKVALPANIPERLSLVLQGLLIRNRHTRWGSVEITRWLQGKTTDGDRKRILDDSVYDLPRANRPYRLNAYSPVDLPSLADAMYREQEAAMQDLMEGDVLLNWVGSIDPNRARDMRATRERLRRDPDQAIFEAIMICDPTRPLMVNRQEAVSAEEWLTHVEGSPNPERHLSPKSLARFEAWLRLYVEPDKRVAAGIAGVMGLPDAERLANLRFLIRPDLPYRIAPNLEALTPKDIVGITYGVPEDWAKGIPVCYQGSFDLWSQGVLHAWMRHRGLDSILTKAIQIQKSLADHGYAAFETVLRLLDPDLPPVRVRLSLAQLAGGLQVAYGKSRTVTIPYSTVGCGVPFGGLRLKGAEAGLALSNQLVNSRSGVARLTLDAGLGIPASRRFEGLIELDGGFTVLEKGPATFRYGAVLPIAGTIGRVFLGAILVALIAGGTRLLLTRVGFTYPIGAAYRAGSVWALTRAKEYPFLHLIKSAGIVIAAFAVSLSTWLWLRSRD